MTKEQQKRIEEMAANYVAGRSIILGIKPLTLEDVKEAFLCGAYDMENLLIEEEDDDE